MSGTSLITFNSNGIYCAEADVYIDPWKPVKKAIITHAHSDHARYGMQAYLAHTESAPILYLRLGQDINLETVEYGNTFFINNVKFSLHPAGHILGSSQVRIEDNEVWVVSGDYKLQPDNFSAEFETVKCNNFITESTFGLPIYRWPDQASVFDDIREWWKQNRMNGKTSVLMGYALGKMQRILKNLGELEAPVFCHGAIYNVNEQLRSAGSDLPYIPPVSGVTDKKEFKNALILATTSALNSTWMKRFLPYSVGYCSGWMAIRGAKNRRGVDRGFVLSDHADWEDLNTAVKNTGAENVYVTHGYTSVFAAWLNENGINSSEIKTQYGDEEETDLVPA